MDTKKKAQIMMLVLAILLLAVAGTAGYVLTGRRGADKNRGAEEQRTARQGSVQEAGETERQQAGETDRQGVGGSDRQQAEGQDGQEADGTGKAINDGLVYLEGGSFSMGSPKEERQREPDEALHEVKISGFYIDPYEVTQRDYGAVMGENPSYFQGEDLPVDSVTWYDAVRYCNALSQARGLTPVYGIGDGVVTWDRSADGYRLLTEAEWEYVARAGTNTVFYAGDQITSDVANFQGSYPYLIEENYVSRKDPAVVTSQNRGKTMEVDSLSPNGFGLYHMYGNVSEWCFDYYGSYDLADPEDPAGALSGSLRVNRGGGYNDFAKHLRSAYRSAVNPVDGDRNTGFRIGRNAGPGEGVVETVYSLDIRMPEDPRILVAYFSYSGNTANGARIIQEKTGADIVEIQMETPYKGNIYEVSQADLNQNIHPALTTRVENMEEYDVLLLGYPNMEQGFECVLCA